MRVLKGRCFWLQEHAQSVAICLGCILPVGTNRIPTAAQTLFIGVAVLADDRRDTIRHLQCDAETDGRAIIKNINGELFSSNLLDKPADGTGNIREGVIIGLARRHIRLPKTRKIWRDKMEMSRQHRNEVTKHVT